MLLPALYQQQGFILLSDLYDILSKILKVRGALSFTMSISCLLLAGALSSAGMEFKKFHLLFALAHLHMDDRLNEH